MQEDPSKQNQQTQINPENEIKEILNKEAEKNTVSRRIGLIAATLGFIVIVIIAVFVLVRISESTDSDSNNTGSDQGNGITDTIENVVDGITNSDRDVKTDFEGNEYIEAISDYYTGQFDFEGKESSIPREEIFSGGPPKDGIPPIDDPKFISVEDADFLNRDGLGIGVVINDKARFYPYQILVWHEIVNDEFEGKPILVTYCPLCLTGIVFDRVIDGEEVEFGVSGLLWESNLLMYDRRATSESESLWSQVLGEAVVSTDRLGDRLDILDYSIVTFEEWIAAYPDTEVLSDDTGSSRDYDQDPYDGYYDDDGSFLFSPSSFDDRLENKDFVLGIRSSDLGGVGEEQFKAYYLEGMPSGTTLSDTFAGREIEIRKDQFGIVSLVDLATGENVPYISGFWFSWVAVHPETELFEV